MIDIHDLTVKYPGSKKAAVDGASLRIEGGEFILLLGASASGKSTLMQALCGFFPHIIPADVSGVIAVEGKSNLSPSEISGIIGMVQQDPEGQFCTETVEDEVAFGPENICLSQNQIEDAVSGALASVKGTHLRFREIATLSGGEKQKVAIASMLAVKPQFLILDEPTSSLDKNSTSEVLSAIAGLRAGTPQLTVIVVEHRPEPFLGMATRLIRIEDGKIEADAKFGTADFGSAKNLATGPKWPAMPAQPSKSRLALSVKNLAYRAGGKAILEDVSFDVFEGSILALMGENGSGKTTLLRHIAGFEKVQSGAIEVFDNLLSSSRGLAPAKLGIEIGLVFQNPNHQIFERTVEGEVLFAPRNFEKNIDEAKIEAGRFASSESVPTASNPHCMSFGQKRRLNIVSASAHGPRLVLLDEPFAGQDAKNAERIAETIARLASQGKTFVIVTHDFDFARSFCTDVVILRGGRITASKRAGELSESDVFSGEHKSELSESRLFSKGPKSKLTGGDMPSEAPK